MTTDASFTRAILANPADLFLRLVYADWLEEQGDARGELFHLQYALTQSAELPRRRELETRQQHLLDAGVRPAAIFAAPAQGIQLSLIPPGEYWMGASSAEIDDALRNQPEARREWFVGEQPRHRVRITRPFYLGVHPVTQSEFAQVMGYNPSDFRLDGPGRARLKEVHDTSRFPVEGVSWYDAIEFCNELSRQQQLSPYYEIEIVKRDAEGRMSDAVVSVRGGQGYRLPTEAEWEYACRAGTTTRFYFGWQLNGCSANVNGQYPYGVSVPGPYLGRPTQVGSYHPNAFGLFDMHGNVWEWCEDWWDEDYFRNSPSENPHGPASGVSRVLRGGAWVTRPLYCRASVRNGSIPTLRDYIFGFRVARNV